MRLQARHGADGDVALPRQRANGGGYGSGGDAGDVAAKTQTISGPHSRPFRCATGCFDATFARRASRCLLLPNGPTIRWCEASGGPLATEAGVVQRPRRNRC